MSATSALEVKSSYHPGVSVARAAELMVDSVLGALSTGEAEHYDRETGRQETFMVAGGGPTAHVIFLFAPGHGSPDRAILHYSEMPGVACAPVPDHKVADLYRALVEYGRR